MTWPLWSVLSGLRTHPIMLGPKVLVRYESSNITFCLIKPHEENAYCAFSNIMLSLWKSLHIVIQSVYYVICYMNKIKYTCQVRLIISGEHSQLREIWKYVSDFAVFSPFSVCRPISIFQTQWLYICWNYRKQLSIRYRSLCHTNRNESGFVAKIGKDVVIRCSPLWFGK